jgi:hypothetical protein
MSPGLSWSILSSANEEMISPGADPMGDKELVGRKGMYRSPEVDLLWRVSQDSTNGKKTLSPHCPMAQLYGHLHFTDEEKA